MKAALYDTQGRVFGVISGAPQNLALDIEDNAGRGIWLEPGTACKPGEHYVVGGELRKFPPQPSPAHYFDYASERWVSDLEALKALVWSQMKARRQAEEFGTFECFGYTFDADATSQARIQGAVQLATLNPGFTQSWVLADNTEVVLTAEELTQVGVALGQHVSAVHAKGRQVRAQIEAASTEAALLAITWPEE